MAIPDLDCKIKLVQHWLAESNLLAIAPVTTQLAPFLPIEDLAERGSRFNAPIISANLPTMYEVASTSTAVKLCKPVTKKQQRVQQAALAQIFDEPGSVTMVSNLQLSRPL